MIPREILKKIRPIELRTNRIVTVLGSARVARPPGQPGQFVQGVLPAGGPENHQLAFLVARIRGGANLLLELGRRRRTHRQIGSFSCHAPACPTTSP